MMTCICWLFLAHLFLVSGGGGGSGCKRVLWFHESLHAVREHPVSAACGIIISAHILEVTDWNTMPAFHQARALECIIQSLEVTPLESAQGHCVHLMGQFKADYWHYMDGEARHALTQCVYDRVLTDKLSARYTSSWGEVAGTPALVWTNKDKKEPV